MIECLIESAIYAGIAFVGAMVFIGLCYFGGLLTLRYCETKTKSKPRHSERRAQY